MLHTALNRSGTRGLTNRTILLTLSRSFGYLPDSTLLPPCRRIDHLSVIGKIIEFGGYFYLNLVLSIPQFPRQLGGYPRFRTSSVCIDTNTLI